MAGIPIAIQGSVLGGPGHGGTITGPCSTVTSTLLAPVARENDSATCSVHDATTIMLLLPRTKTVKDLDNANIAVVGDGTACGAIITTGDPNVLVEL